MSGAGKYRFVEYLVVVRAGTAMGCSCDKDDTAHRRTSDAGGGGDDDDDGSFDEGQFQSIATGGNAGVINDVVNKRNQRQENVHEALKKKREAKDEQLRIKLGKIENANRGVPVVGNTRRGSNCSSRKSGDDDRTTSDGASADLGGTARSKIIVVGSDRTNGNASRDPSNDGLDCGRRDDDEPKKIEFVAEDDLPPDVTSPVNGAFGEGTPFPAGGNWGSEQSLPQIQSPRNDEARPGHFGVRRAPSSLQLTAVDSKHRESPTLAAGGGFMGVRPCSGAHFAPVVNSSPAAHALAPQSPAAMGLGHVTAISSGSFLAAVSAGSITPVLSGVFAGSYNAKLPKTASPTTPSCDDATLQPNGKRAKNLFFMDP